MFMVSRDRVKSTFMVDGEVYKRIRILAIEKGVEVSAVIEEAMREKLERDFPHYKPLSPMQPRTSQSQPPQQQKLQVRSGQVQNQIIYTLRRRNAKGSGRVIGGNS